MSYIEKAFPLEASSAIAYKINFHNLIYPYSDKKISDFGTILCHDCHHIKQKYNVMVPRNSLKKEYGRLSYFGFCVSIDCKNELLNTFEDISQNDFRPVTTKSEEIVCYQLTPQHIMEPIHPYNNMQLYHCKSCGETYWIESKEETALYITKNLFRNLCSLNLTFEHSPLSLGSIIVSSDVYHFLIKKWPKMEFTPILLK